MIVPPSMNQGTKALNPSGSKVSSNRCVMIAGVIDIHVMIIKLYHHDHDHHHRHGHKQQQSPAIISAQAGEEQQPWYIPNLLLLLLLLLLLIS